MSPTVDQFPNDRPPTPLDARRAAERRQQQAQEREEAAQTEVLSQPDLTEGINRSMAQATREFPEPPEADEISEDAMVQPVSAERKRRKSGLEWLSVSLGGKWWQLLGIDSDQQPANEGVVTRIIALCWKGEYSQDMLGAIVNGWLQGTPSHRIASMHSDITNTKFVDNRINLMKRKLLQGLYHGFQEPYVEEAKPEAVEAPIAAAEVVKQPRLGTRAATWLADTYGISWWRMFGFEHHSTVDINSLAGELCSRVGLSLEEDAGQLIKGWLEGKTLLQLAGTNEGGKVVRGFLEQTRAELEMQYKESRPKPAPEKSRAQLFGGTVSGRVVELEVPEVVEKHVTPAAKIAKDWAERLRLSENATSQLTQFLNPTGSNIMDRDGYSAFQKLRDYIQDEFKTFDDERLEGFNDRQRNALREITGIDRGSETFQEIRKLRPGMPSHQTVARFIRDYSQVKYNHQRPEDLAVEVLKAFETLFEASAPQEAK